MLNTFLAGNTVRLKATFYGFNKTEVDPDLVKFILYDAKFTKLSEINITANRLDKGIYYHDNIVSNTDIDKKFYYEFYGEVGGKPILNRGEYVVKFSQT